MNEVQHKPCGTSESVELRVRSVLFLTMASIVPFLHRREICTQKTPTTNGQESPIDTEDEDDGIHPTMAVEEKVDEDVTWW